MRANVFLYKPEENIFSLTFLSLIRNWTTLNVVVLYQIIRKLNKNNRTLNIVFKFTVSSSALFSLSTTLLFAGKSKHENNNAILENNIIPRKKLYALIKQCDEYISKSWPIGPFPGTSVQFKINVTS